jgi:hypothetical protein
MSIGQATIVLDDKASERAFDPANTASPYFLGTSGIAPRRFVKIFGGTAAQEPLFVGRINDLDIDYVQPDNSFALVTCTDDLSTLARTNLLAFTPSSELSSARVNTILDRPEVAFSTANRSIATGVATLGTVAYDSNDNVKGQLSTQLPWQKTDASSSTVAAPQSSSHASHSRSAQQPSSSATPQAPRRLPRAVGRLRS